MNCSKELKSPALTMEKTASSFSELEYKRKENNKTLLASNDYVIQEAIKELKDDKNDNCNSNHNLNNSFSNQINIDENSNLNTIFNYYNNDNDFIKADEQLNNGLTQDEFNMYLDDYFLL